MCNPTVESESFFMAPAYDAEPQMTACQPTSCHDDVHIIPHSHWREDNRVNLVRKMMLKLL
jgi:hypothetical protein